MTYATDRLHEEIAYVAFHFHWSFEEILDLEVSDYHRQPLFSTRPHLQWELDALTILPASYAGLHVRAQIHPHMAEMLLIGGVPASRVPLLLILLLLAVGLTVWAALQLRREVQFATERANFVANVSHELKTPLTSISGYAETLLTDRPDDETVQKFLGTILGNSRRMHRLVDDLLDLSRIESGHWQPSPARLSAGAAVREAVASFMDRAAEREVTLEAAAPDPDVAFEADPEAVRQVLSNLVDNALRYTPAGGRVTVRAERSDGGVMLSVSDTGSGIPQEHLPRIFERFYRADPSRSREEGGTGLGLSIVRRLCTLYGWDVQVRPGERRGVVATLTFDTASVSPSANT